jgi:hypothetical protein
MSAPPANRTWRTAGNNCHVEVDLTMDYGGDLVGTAVEHFRIVAHAPCPPDGPAPHKYYETIHVRGTFVGEVAGREGTFEFIKTARNIPLDSGGWVWISRMVILSGTGELANLHGRLEIDTDDNYTGQIHFDP